MSFQIINELLKLTPCGRLLDVGCGDGSLFKNLEEFEVYGIDNSVEAVFKSRSNLIKARLYDAEKPFPFPLNYFDVVTAVNVLEHVEHPGLIIKNVNNHLRRRGYFLLKFKKIIRVKNLLLSNGFSIISERHFLRMSDRHLPIFKGLSNESLIIARKDRDLM